MTTHRLSPVHAQLEALGAQFAARNEMVVAVSLGDDESARADKLGFADLSHLYKTGFKGGHAAAWLQSQGFKLPTPNGWTVLEDGGLLARLANSEFFIEDAGDGAVAARVREAMRQPVVGVYPVMRQDAGFALVGERVNELLVETCNVNFLDPAHAIDALVMTSMVGVSVLVIRRDTGQGPYYRLWCDPTMAAYLWNTLAEIARDLDGGPIGLNALARWQQA